MSENGNFVFDIRMCNRYDSLAVEASTGKRWREKIVTKHHPEVVAAIQVGDSESLRILLAEDSSRASARDEAGVSAILHALYRRRHDWWSLLLVAGLSWISLKPPVLDAPTGRRNCCCRMQIWRRHSLRWIHCAAFRLLFRAAGYGGLFSG